MTLPFILDKTSLQKGYATGAFSPKAILSEIASRIESSHAHNIWIRALNLDEMLAYLDQANPKGCLYGIPFAIKDNIDLENVETTAGCSAYAYTPTTSATVVQALLDEGAIPIGKTNMDQFATGLVGTRSPYGICHHAFHPECISGGSSSGSAVAVAKGLCTFSLGTDTAGSGRVPAALHGLIGVKPTPGMVSMSGVVPACRSLDTVSLFTSTAEDALNILPLMTRKDENDPLQVHSLKSAPDQPCRYGALNPEVALWKGRGEYKKHYLRALTSLKQRGVQIELMDLKEFFEVALMLYEGPWVAERTSAVGDFIEANLDTADPTVAKIILGGRKITGVQTFDALLKLRSKKNLALQIFEQVDGVILPTIGGWFTRADVAADPIGVNSYLGSFTNFANLLELSATAFPAWPGEPAFGLTLFAPKGEDLSTLVRAAKLSHQLKSAPIAVVGAHLEGMPLNHQLTERGGTLSCVTSTSNRYRLYDIGDGKPGLVRDRSGASIELEVWDLPLDQWGSFVDAISHPLSIGKVELADGRWVSGFICDPNAIAEAKEITSYGGWRAYLKSEA